jgi:Zn-dependent protease with chaperone function
MIELGHVLFNLLGNSVVSFLAALAIVAVAKRLIRLEPGAGQLWLLLLPFGKVLFDLAQGVPASSFLWAKLLGHTQDLGAVRIGVGWHDLGIGISAELAAFSGGLIYPQSIADVLDAALSRRVAGWFPGALALGALAIGLGRVGARLWRSRALTRRVLQGAHCLELRRCGSREVTVRVSPSYAGVPFAAGVLRPYIVFSARVHAALTSGEHEAAVQHELAHIAHRDPLLLAGVSLLNDLFWFLPGSRGLFRRIRELLELRADDAAIAAGAEPAALASALVAAGEIVHTPIVAAAMASTPSALALRVRRLLADAPRQSVERSRGGRRAITAALIALVTVTIAQAVFFGNHAAALVRFGSG